MDALPFIKGILSQPALRVFLSDNVPINDLKKDNIGTLSYKILSFLMKIKFDLVEDTDYKKVDLIKDMQKEARYIGRASREHIPDLATNWKKTLYFNLNDMDSCSYLQQDGEMEQKDIEAVINSLDDKKTIEDLFPHKADSSNCFTNEEKGRALFLMTVFPACRELKEPYKILEFLLELTKELDDLPQLICKACEGLPLALLLIGSLLSFKPMAYDTWNKVKDHVVAIKESGNPDPNNHLLDVFTYCYKDLPNFLKPCFLYLACYPIDYEIPARSLIEIWIAEGFVTPENGETTEDTARMYLEQLVQRSLVCVSKRSFLGTIKCCRVGRSIHEYVINQSYNEGFLAANPDQKDIKSMSRVAINHDNKNQNPILVLNRNIVSFSAFHVNRNDVKMSDMLWVLELRKSAIPKKHLTSMCYLRYLGLRRVVNISELPTTMTFMEFLQTLDIRDTNIETLPQSLWTISTLRHLYVNPSPQIQGPPSTASILDLQILKTVTVPKSWLENVPQFLKNLRKLGLSNRDNSYWKSISVMLSHTVNLLSMTIIGDIIPSEFIDTRAFPNLETVKSIKLVGKWTCRNLIIDNIQFPSNLTKLTLTNSGLKEDPMPRLGKLQALKYLSLQNEAYIGKKMVCSANEFPQLQFLQLSKLGNMEIWEVKSMAMSQLTTLHVDQCWKLKNIPHLEHVIDKFIDN